MPNTDPTAKGVVSINETDGRSVIPALLNPDGTKQADQSAAFQYIDYEVQPQLSWSFLQT